MPTFCMHILCAHCHDGVAQSIMVRFFSKHVIITTIVISTEAPRASGANDDNDNNTNSINNDNTCFENPNHYRLGYAIMAACSYNVHT